VARFAQVSCHQGNQDVIGERVAEGERRLIATLQQLFGLGDRLPGSGLLPAGLFDERMCPGCSELKVHLAASPAQRDRLCGMVCCGRQLVPVKENLGQV